MSCLRLLRVGVSQVGHGSLSAIADPELPVDRCKMELHRMHGHLEAGCDLGVRETTRGEPTTSRSRRDSEAKWRSPSAWCATPSTSASLSSSSSMQAA